MVRIVSKERGICFYENNATVNKRFTHALSNSFNFLMAEDLPDLGSNLKLRGLVTIIRNLRWREFYFSTRVYQYLVVKFPSKIMVQVQIRGIDVNFPFQPYGCQVSYMEKVIQCLQEVR